MAYKLLILDDDGDFNSLLTDIFEQADYIVSSVQDPREAVDLFKSEDYDLVVTDHKMPDMTGASFMKLIKELKPDVPVIMVSGYLENNTIRDLIRDGVGGVFLKPLNIFSLLERTAELIDESLKIKKAKESGAISQDYVGDLNSTGVDSDFRSFPCKSVASIDFAEKLNGLHNFKSTLTLMGEPGTHFRAICEDLRRSSEPRCETFIYLSVGSFDENQVLAMIEKENNSVERVTCVLLEVENMSDEQKGLAVHLAKSSGPFASLDVGLRTVFCISGDLDELFDQGLINDHLYILMGTAEIQVPPLRECALDIAIMAQQIVVDLLREKAKSTVPVFDGSARNLFRQYAWPNNYQELYETVKGVVEMSDVPVYTQTEIHSVLRSKQEVSPVTQMARDLEDVRVDYLRAAMILLSGNRQDAARFFGVEQSSVDTILNR